MDATLVDPNLVAELEERAALKSTQNFWVRRLFLCGVVAVFSVVLFFASPAVVRGALHTISPDELQSEIDGVLKQVSSLDDEREKLIAAADKASTAEENAKLNDQAKRIEARKDSYFSRLDSVQTAYQQSEGYILQLKFFMALLGLLSLTYAGYIYLIVPRTAGLQGLFEDIDEMTPLTDHLSLPPRSSAIDTIEDDVISESERNAANSRDKFDYIMRTVVRRLEKEISQLGQRANVNLLIGSIIAGVGIIALGYALWGEPILNSDVDDWQDKVLKLGARASFVLLIEFFAFFFLRLYSNTLGEIKYFQNELTNFQSKALAIRTSLSLTAPVSLEALLGELSKTERNFVLRKGESTVELRQAEIEQNGVSQMSKLLNQLLKGIGPAKG